MWYVCFNSPTQWSRHELPSDVWHPELQGWGNPSQWSAWHPSQTASWPGFSEEGSTSRSSLWASQWWRHHLEYHCYIWISQYETWDLPKCCSCCFAAKCWRCSSQRIKCRPETGDLGNWCQCGDLQGKVSGMKIITFCYKIFSSLRGTFDLMFLFSFQRFLQRFIDPTSTEDENAGLDLNEPLYMQKLEEVVSLCSGSRVVTGQVEDRSWFKLLQQIP